MKKNRDEVNAKQLFTFITSIKSLEDSSLACHGYLNGYLNGSQFNNVVQTRTWCC